MTCDQLTYSFGADKVTSKQDITKELSVIDAMNSTDSSIVDFLYCMLARRDSDSNISHKEMPSYEDHSQYVKYSSSKYRVWYKGSKGRTYYTDTEYEWVVSTYPYAHPKLDRYFHDRVEFNGSVFNKRINIILKQLSEN